MGIIDFNNILQESAVKDLGSRSKSKGKKVGVLPWSYGYHMTSHVAHVIQRGAAEEEDEGPVELLAKPREYKVKFSFPNPPPLNPPILGAYGEP